jgi:uncharacterized protein YfkK (UPF0435 family)
MDNVKLENNNDKLALINFSKYCIEDLKKTNSDDEIYDMLKNNFNFSDGFIDQII